MATWVLFPVESQAKVVAQLENLVEWKPCGALEGCRRRRENGDYHRAGSRSTGELKRTVWPQNSGPGLHSEVRLLEHTTHHHELFFGLAENERDSASGATRHTVPGNVKMTLCRC
jgi:hypothetical protein